MMEAGGVDVPAPPKRPTVIRASKPPENGSVVSPDRPGPPVPSRPAPAVPARTNDSATVRPPIPVPARPSDRPRPAPAGVSRPPSPVPGRTGEATPVVKSNGTNKMSVPQPPPASSKPSTGKVKPEITIVCARPMSEVGFRGQSSVTGPPKAEEVIKPEPAKLPQRPKEQPLIQLDDDSPDTSNDRSPRGPPPTLPLGPRPGAPPTAPHRPSPSLRRPEKSPVPAKRVTDDQTTTAEKQDNESRPIGVNPKLGVPLPPVPRNPPVPLRPPQVNSAPNILQKSDNQSNENNNTADGLSSEVKDQEKSDTTASASDMYAVINKPKRPTIIRPGRPSVKDNRSEPPKLPPKVTPRLEDSDSSPDNTNDNNEDVNKEVPEFLRHKLKSTVKDNTGTQGSDKSSPVGELCNSNPPHVASKPKPTVLPKPKIAAKPSIANKPVIAKQINSDSKEVKVPDHPSQTVNSDSVPVNKVENDSNTSLPKRPSSFKRPTIIRPARPGQFGSSENIRKESSPQDVESVAVSGSVDDSAVKMRQQPPLPTKRPVSMTNIPQALAQEAAMSLRSSSSSHSVQSQHLSSDNLNNNAPQPKPVPRPVARSRPMSIAAGDVSSLHSQRPSVSPRLQHGMDSVSRQPDKPAKPARQPMKAVPSPVCKVSSSSEDEFVEAQSKPDRPNAPPKLGNRSPLKEAGEMKKSPPPRPGGPPSKTASPEEIENDAETVKMRPERPSNKPARPMSMPVKSLLPSKPQLPKAGGAGQKKKYGLPSLPARPGPGHPAYHHMMCVPHGQALHEYTARQEDELSFTQGTIIILVRAVDTEWVVGKVDDQEGMFPRGFVKVLMPLPGEKLAEESSDEEEEYYDTSPEKPDTIGHGPRCRARFDFEGEGRDDLAFEEGEVIQLLERVGTEWRKGQCNGRTGLFPLAFVEVIEDLPEEENVTSPIVKALFDFEGEQGDLNFQAGETINVQYCVNEEWLYGEIGDRRGQFPIQFIDHVPQDLPPFPKEVKQESSPLESTHHDQKSRSTDALDDALGQVDTHDGYKAESRSEPPVTTEQPYCIATYDYPGQTEDDLSFNEGDRIDIVERVNADWLKGKLHGIVGIFPAAFVEVKVDMLAQATEVTPLKTEESPSHTDNQPEGQVTVALYEFHGEADNELTFDTGDQLIVQELVEGAEDWRWGIHNGNRGIFPAAFVDCNS